MRNYQRELRSADFQNMCTYFYFFKYQDAYWLCTFLYITMQDFILASRYARFCTLVRTILYVVMYKLYAIMYIIAYKIAQYVTHDV